MKYKRKMVDVNDLEPGMIAVNNIMYEKRF